MNLNSEAANLDGRPPANNQSGVVFPTQAAGVHVRPQTDIVTQHVCDPLFCADIVDFDSLWKKHNFSTVMFNTALFNWGLRLITHHVVGPGDEISSPLDVSDWALAFMENRRLPAVQPVSFIQKKLWERKQEHNYLKRTPTQECSWAARPTEGSRWTAHHTGAASKGLRLTKGWNSLTDLTETERNFCFTLQMMR